MATILKIPLSIFSNMNSLGFFSTATLRHLHKHLNSLSLQLQQHLHRSSPSPVAAAPGRQTSRCSSGTRLLHVECLPGGRLRQVLCRMWRCLHARITAAPGRQTGRWRGKQRPRRGDTCATARGEVRDGARRGGLSSLVLPRPNNKDAAAERIRQGHFRPYDGLGNREGIKKQEIRDKGRKIKLSMF
jgi:hypothetical protein